MVRRQEAANHAAGQPLGATIRVDGGSGESGGLLDGVGGKGAESSRWWRPRANRVRGGLALKPASDDLSALPLRYLLLTVRPLLQGRMAAFQQFEVS